MNLKLFLAGFLLLVASVAAVNSSVNATGQTLFLNGTDCVSLFANDTLLATSCGTNPTETASVFLSYGGNLLTPLTTATIYGQTVNAPPFPTVNANVTLLGGQAYYPDDSRFNFKVSCVAQNNTIYIQNDSVRQVCDAVNVLETLEPNGEYFNPALNIRIKAPQLSNEGFTLKTGDTFNRSNICYGNLTLKVEGIVNETATPTPAATPAPCGAGTHFEGNACVANTNANGGTQSTDVALPTVGGFPVLDLAALGLLAFYIYSRQNKPKSETE